MSLKPCGTVYVLHTTRLMGYFAVPFSKALACAKNTDGDSLTFLANIAAYYNCDSSTIRVRFEHDSSTIRARHATTRYEVFRALAHEIDSSTPRESVVGVSCMLIDSSLHTIFTLYLYRPTLHRVCEYARNCLYKRN